jgi:hypothetical protein
MLSSCRVNDAREMRRQKKYADVSLFAWTGDTVQVWRFALTRRNTFLYCISKDTNRELVNCYLGKVHGNVNSDTIFLSYTKGKKPSMVFPYLIRELSGNYLIQSFTDSSERIFMRIHQHLR